MAAWITHTLCYQHSRALFLVAFVPLLYSSANAITGNETDQLALLEFKARITADPLGIMNSWKESTHFCNWFGVTCRKRRPRVTELNLTSLQLGGSISPHIGNLSFLKVIDLSNNTLINQIPPELGYLGRLESLYLHHNSLHGKIPSLQQLKAINKLIISHNTLGTRGPGDLNFLCSLTNATNLQALDIANNNIGGSLPECTCNLTSKLTVIWLKVNHISGSIPACTANFAAYVSMAKNNLHGIIPRSLCNSTNLDVLDLQDNHLEGTIPDCLIAMSQTLGVLNLRGNNIGGSIPDKFGASCRLETLDFNGNVLQGQIPRSLANCKKLRVLNLGDNQLDDTFPCELTTLSQLQILILKSNRFRGTIACPGEASIWPLLQILDLASNHFSGEITAQFIPKWRLMIGGTKELQSTPSRLAYHSKVLGSIQDFEDGVTVTFKNNEFKLQYVLKMFTTIDLSDNAFYGEIPREWGNLNALVVLNLSHNSLSGIIPPSFANLSQLESLDLSHNAINGAIPREFADLSFLESLNLSFNKLVGPIPTSTQLQSFDASSYEGNPGLYGPPLTALNANVPGPKPSTSSDESQWSASKSEVEWMLQGAQVGFPVGLIIFVGPLLYIKRWRQWYSRHLDRLVIKSVGRKDQLRVRTRRGRPQLQQ